MSQVRYLTPSQLTRIADAATAGHALTRDHGLLASAAERPATALFGKEQYLSLLEKSAALMHSIARFHPLVDGNKRLAWLAVYTLVTLNGGYVVATNDQVYDVTMQVAAGELDEVRRIAKALEPLVNLPGEAR